MNQLVHHGTVCLKSTADQVKEFRGTNFEAIDPYDIKLSVQKPASEILYATLEGAY